MMSSLCKVNTDMHILSDIYRHVSPFRRREFVQKPCPDFCRSGLVSDYFAESFTPMDKKVHDYSDALSFWHNKAFLQ